MKRLVIIILLSFSIPLSGCASINSKSHANSDSSNSEYNEEKPSQGTDTMLSMLGLAVVLGIVFAIAPPEAYK